MNNTVDNPKICIIGAGPCGITAAKNLIQQGLTNIVVFEKNNTLGGNWIFSENNSHSSIYETTHIISSKRLSEYDDFPMPSHYPDYPSHAQILSYFNDYADHFGVQPFIQFNTIVEAVSRCNSKQWKVVYRNQAGIHEAVFDYLLVANGHHWDPLLPSYPGKFSGEVLHAHDYKRAAPFKNQRVLVVGSGNSACDIAVEIARISSKTCLSMRRGQHIFPKFIFGKSTDVAFAKISRLPLWLKQSLVQAVIRIIQGRYDKYRLKKPSSKPLETHPTINSELLYFIRHGKIIPREGIKTFNGEHVYFTNGHVEAFDVIIFATGYKISFPFFSPELLDYNGTSPIPLYLKMMHLIWDNLYFIGLFQPQGCIWPLADHQSKIVASIIKGTLQRPANLKEKMIREEKYLQRRFKSRGSYMLEVDYHDFRRCLLNAMKAGK